MSSHALALSVPRKTHSHEQMEATMSIIRAYAPVVLLVFQAIAAFAEAPFAIRIVEAGSEVPLGVPPSITIEVRNISSTGQAMAFSKARVGVEVVTSPALPENHPTGGDCGDSGLNGFLVFADPVAMVPSDWVFHRRLSIPVSTVGQYSARAFFLVDSGGKRAKGEPEMHWAGKVYSEIVTVHAFDPTGVDAQAFSFIVNQVQESKGDAVTRFSSAFVYGDARGQLFREFPESTYTAYQLYRSYCGRKPWQDNVKVLSALNKAVVRMHNSVPCDRSDCAESGSVQLRGEDYLNWQNLWFERVLEHHPDIWFADDVRFHLALNHFLLGEITLAEEELKVLAGKKDSLWASKTQDLLRQLETKGVLRDNDE